MHLAFQSQIAHGFTDLFKPQIIDQSPPKNSSNDQRSNYSHRHPEGDVKRLRDIEPPELRLRVGAYRIRFYDHGDTIEILALKHRSKAYP